MIDEKLYTMIDISKEAGVSAGLVWKFMDSGKLPQCDFAKGNRRFWKEDSFRKAIEVFASHIKWSRTKGKNSDG